MLILRTGYALDTGIIRVRLFQAEDKYDPKTRELIAAADAARRAYDEADRELRDVERDIKQVKEVMEKDYGECLNQFHLR